MVTRGCCPLVTLLLSTVPSVSAETSRLWIPSMGTSLTLAMAAIGKLHKYTSLAEHL